MQGAKHTVLFIAGIAGLCQIDHADFRFGDLHLGSGLGDAGGTDTGGLTGRVLGNIHNVHGALRAIRIFLEDDGHATKDGKRTKANPFLKNAIDQVLPEYEAAVEEAIKK